MTKIEIKNIVKQTLKVIFSENDISMDAIEDSEIFGINGVLNSLAVLRFVVDLEDYFFVNQHVSINLSSENAFNPLESPFRSVDSIVDLIFEKVQV